MKWLFAASEIGSVRAVLPVCRAAAEEGDHCLLAGYGVMATEAKGMDGVVPGLPEDGDALARCLASMDLDGVLFSVNVSDPAPLALARAARLAGVPVVHVLDYWNGYLDRLARDGREPFIPDAYAVPDGPAADAAREQGVPGSVIHVTGHPGLADLGPAYERARACGPGVVERLGLDPARGTVAFVSEPVALDNGRSCVESVSFRGYTEETVIPEFLRCLGALGEEVQVVFLPHPREDAAALEAFVSGCAPRLAFAVARTVRGRDVLPHVAGVAGMASTLVYEAWLCGVSVVSLQPDLRNDSLRIMQGRPGAWFVEDEKDMDGAIRSWLAESRRDAAGRAFRSDLFAHERAASEVLGLMRGLAWGRRGGPGA